MKYVLVVQAEELTGVTALRPANGWLDLDIAYSILLTCNICGEEFATTLSLDPDLFDEADGITSNIVLQVLHYIYFISLIIFSYFICLGLT